MVSVYEKALKRMWTGSCSVYVRELHINPDNGRDEAAEILLHENIPCRLSFSSISSAGQNESAATVQQVVKLFLAKDIEIPPGSKLVVTQEGKTTAYAKSGSPAVYPYHQEIMLERFKEYA